MEKDTMKQRFLKLPVTLKLINASIAGFISLIFVYPLDLVKTRLQSQRILPSGKPEYNSILDCARKTYRAEGFLGMYRGSRITAILLMPEKAVKLVANDIFREILRPAEGKFPIHRQVLAGMMTGTLQSIVTTPLELLKIQMQNTGRIAAVTGQPKKTTTKVIQGVFNQYGIFGLYKGIVPTIVRDSLFTAIYFPLFFLFNNIGPRRNDGSGEAASWVSFGSGLISGSIAGFLLTPVDVVKTRLQIMDKIKREFAYTGIVDAFVKVLQFEGARALFKGGACRTMVIAPFFGILQTVYLLGIAERIVGAKYYKVE